MPACNGQNGQPGYVAVNEVIYDVSETWFNGTHKEFVPGNDITEEIVDSPHGLTVLGKPPIIGGME